MYFGLRMLGVVSVYECSRIKQVSVADLDISLDLTTCNFLGQCRENSLSIRQSTGTSDLSEERV